jgi:anti-anti-sigma factor
MARQRSIGWFEHASRCICVPPACSWLEGNNTVRVELGHPASSAGRGASSSKRERRPDTRLLSIRDLDGVYRARLIDQNLRSLDIAKLRGEIVALHTPGHPPAVMLSMRGIETMASSSLGAIAELSTDLERIGGVLVLYNLPKEIAKMMRKTKLDRVIHTAKGRPQARKRALAVQKKFGESSQMHAA